MMMSRNTKLVAVFAVILIVGIAIWQLKSRENPQNITSFDECAAAGYPVMESYPEQCKTPDGRTFTKQASKVNGWQEQTVYELNLHLSYPSDLTFRKEIGDNDGNIRTVAFYIEKGDQNNPEYQLYALYLADKEGSARDLELAKTGMDPASIKDTSIDGYNGVEGIANANDPKKHYLTVILKDGRLFSVSTYPPQPENKELTDKIIETFNFQ